MILFSAIKLKLIIGIENFELADKIYLKNKSYHPVAFHLSCC
jgi:hypothetical protein